jgi:hypothetical protein
MAVAGMIREESMADEQRLASMPAAMSPDQAAPADDRGADVQAAEQAATQAAGALADAPADAWPSDPNELVQEARGLAQRVIAQATGQADQATRAAGKQMAVTAAAVREKSGGAGRFSTVSRQVASGLEQGGGYLEQQGATGAAGAVGRRWWALLAVLALGLAAIVLSRRRGAPANPGAEPEPAPASD